MSQSPAAHMPTPGQHQGKEPQSRRSNLRVAFILVSVAAVFFAGVIAKYWLFY